jgi:hypothetical protein
MHFDGYYTLIDINDLFDYLLRYASQLETLVLDTYHSWDDPPHDFWDSFTALQLLGLRYNVLNDRDWGGWTTTPSLVHPFTYLVCRNCNNVVATVTLRSIWTYHEEVTSVIEDGTSGEYYVLEDIREGGRRDRRLSPD